MMMKLAKNWQNEKLNINQLYYNYRHFTNWGFIYSLNVHIVYVFWYYDFHVLF